MVRKNMGRVGNLEKDMEEVKAKLERLAEMEKKMECLTHGLARVLSSLEETTRSVNSIGKSNPGEKGSAEKDISNALLQEKTLMDYRQVEVQPKIGASDGLVKLPYAQVIDSKETDSTKSKGKMKEPKEGKGQMGKPVIDEEIIGLPPYSDFGVKGRLMKVKGRIRGKEVVVLVKTGTTHNFISSKLVKELQLPSMTTRNYRVETIRGNSICKGVKLEMPGLIIVEEFLPIQLLDNVDVILGTKWFFTLEKVTFCNEEGLFTMKIEKGNKLIVWRADPEL